MAAGLSGLSLAYIGDAVFELKMRKRVLEMSPDAAVASLHKTNSGLVCAHAQSEMVRLLADVLTEEETAVYRRGRNAHPNTIPKNQSMSDYRRATGFEALMGYLYLEGRENRIDELIDTAFALKEKQNAEE